AETGRQTVNDRVQLARMIGQFAVNRGRRRVDEAVNNLRTNAASGPTPSSAGDGVDEDTEVDIPVRLSADEEVMADEIGIIEDDLAIPSYDSLAASQVVPRLEGLTPVELESVRRYEEAHRARKTVLGKITLLQ